MRQVILGGTGYDVIEADGQFIFEEYGGCWATHTIFAFEKTREINDTPGIWYIVELDSSSERVPASHIVQAHEWLCENYGRSFESEPAQAKSMVAARERRRKQS